MNDRIRVVELGRGVATAHAAKLLADEGADVIKVEPPGGDPTRQRGPFVESTGESGSFLALNGNKHSVCLDLAAGSTELARLLAWADIVVHDMPEHETTKFRLDAAALRVSHPALVVLAITPFGATGPRASFAATELVVANAAGWASLTPASHSDPALPPLKVFGHQCALMTAICGAMTALAAYREVQRSGVGDVIDLAEQAYVASVLEAAIPNYSYMDRVSYRYHPHRLTPWKIFEAKDAPIFLICVEDDQWQRLVTFMGSPDWATEPLFDTVGGRSENADLIEAMLQTFIGEWEADALFHAAQEHRICFAPVLSFSQLATNEHLLARGFIAPTSNETARRPRLLNSPALTTGGRRGARGAAPAPGADQACLDALTPRTASARLPVKLPLDGIRVIDLTWAWAGPFCSMNLAHLGADVIRLESRHRLDIYRRYMINPPDLTPGTDTSGMFNQWNQGKRSVSLNLRSPEGVAIARDLLADSDVLVQNYATGVMDRMGLGWKTLQADNPALVMASISGYGQTGPFREYMAYGPAAAPLTGLCSATGYAGETADEIGLSIPDATAGITAAWAIVAALQRRDLTGAGDHIDVSLWEATAAIAFEGWMQVAGGGPDPVPRGNRDPAMAPHGCFGCAGDNAWIAIACRDDADWQRLAGLIDPALTGNSRFRTLADRKANEAELEQRVSAWTHPQDRFELMTRLQAAGVPAFPSLDPADLLADPQLAARGMIERLDHPVVGRRAHMGIPWRFSERTNGVRSPAPCMGADTQDVLTTRLGYDKHHIAALTENGILY